MKAMQYTILIQWSDEDNCFVVSLPDFTDIMQPCTHGETYIEALQNAQEVLEMLVESALKNRNPLPKPQRFQTIPLSSQVA
jgi:antitoxin HicB